MWGKKEVKDKSQVSTLGDWHEKWYTLPKRKFRKDFAGKNDELDFGHVAIEESVNTLSLSKPLTMWLFFRALLNNHNIVCFPTRTGAP